jgi:hypothetical protein
LPVGTKEYNNFTVLSPLNHEEKSMKINFPDRFIWMLSVLIIISLACQGGPTTVEQVTPTSTSAQPPQAITTPTKVGIVPVGLPEKRANQAGDEDSSHNANNKMASGGEKFIRGWYERPFNADTMDTYFPYIDIVDTQGFKDDVWGFGSITVSNTDSNGHLPGNYGLELDLNKDGRGEWLILVANPSSTDWQTQGVTVWNDANGDVGGAIPTAADENSPGDGYEANVFNEGSGKHPDDAWTRISPDDPKTIIIAFKLSMIGDPASFAMGAWAGNASLDPSLFDFNDHMTHIEAGSPLPDLFVYPLKELAEIDSTCRMAIAFSPNGNEPGLCQTIQEQQPVVVGCTPPAAGIMNPCP